MPDDTPDTGDNAAATLSEAVGALVIDKPAAAADSGADDETDWKAEADRWKGLARKHEDRAKQNAAAAKERDDLRKASMTDVEKAVAEARSEAKAEVVAAMSGRLVEAEVRAALQGRSVDADALLDTLDRSRFVTEDGDVDAKAVKAWAEKVAPATQATASDLGQGARGQAKSFDMNSLIRRGAGFGQ